MALKFENASYGHDDKGKMCFDVWVEDNERGLDGVPRMSRRALRLSRRDAGYLLKMLIAAFGVRLGS